MVRTENGKRLEPLELLVIDCPENFIGIVMELMGTRRGEMAKMVNHNSGRVRMEFRIPSRGLIGLRSQLMTDTRGTALIHSLLEGWTEYAGDMAMRLTGALVCDRAGVSVAYAIWGIQERGEMFVGPGIEVYEGMIVGENAREDDMNVNITKEKKQTNMRSSSADEAIRLIPPRDMTLEKAIEFIADDEYVEVDPEVDSPAQESPRRQEAPQALADRRPSPDALSSTRHPVKANTVIFDLVNPQLQQETLDAEYQLKGAQAAYEQTKGAVAKPADGQSALWPRASSQYRTAEMVRQTKEELGANGLALQLDVKTAQVQAEELAKENDLAQKEVQTFDDSIARKLAVQEATVNQKRAMYELKKSQ